MVSVFLYLFSKDYRKELTGNFLKNDSFDKLLPQKNTEKNYNDLLDIGEPQYEAVQCLYSSPEYSQELTGS